MDTRRDYIAPAIAAEDVLEQTSLACHATVPYPDLVGQCFAGVQLNFAAVMQCLNDVSKGGAFVPELCHVEIDDPSAIHVLS